MANLFKQPIFLLIVSIFVLATASPKDDGGKKGLFSFGKHTDDDDTSITSSSSSTGGKVSFSLLHKKTSEDDKITTGDSSDNPECKCDSELKDFVDKFILLFRAYASKELAPEIRSMVLKISDFVLSYLAKEKPDEMGKIHTFLESSVKVTGDAVAKGGVAKRDVSHS